MNKFLLGALTGVAATVVAVKYKDEIRQYKDELKDLCEEIIEKCLVEKGEKIELEPTSSTTTTPTI